MVLLTLSDLPPQGDLRDVDSTAHYSSLLHSPRTVNSTSFLKDKELLVSLSE